MAIVDRDVAPLSNEELEQLVRLDPASTPAADTDGPGAWSRPGMVLLAALAASAGVIHLAMVPSHAGAWLPEGIAFAIAGWLQIGLAALFLARPSRVALRVSCILNLVFVGAWVVSRVWGWPVGPQAGVALSATFIDSVCVALLNLAPKVGRASNS